MHHLVHHIIYSWPFYWAETSAILVSGVVAAGYGTAAVVHGVQALFMHAPKAPKFRVHVNWSLPFRVERVATTAAPKGESHV